MKFSEEYKKSAESLSPDRETIERMKAAVLKELQEHPDVPAEPLPEYKKPLPLRRIAYIGGAVAACAAITVAAVNIVPSLKDASNIVSSASTGNTAGIDMSSSMAADEVSGIESTARLDNAETSPAIAETIDICEDTTAATLEAPAADDADAGESTDGVSADKAADATDGIAAADSLPSTTTVTTTTAAPVHSTTNAPEETTPDTLPDDKKGHTNPDSFAPDASTDDSLDETTDAAYSTTEHGNPETGSEDYLSPTGGLTNGTEDCCTAEEWMTTEEEVSTEEESDDRGNPMEGCVWTLVRSPKGWLTADGERYDGVKDATAPIDTSNRYEAYAPTESNTYYIVIIDDMLYLYDVRMNYLGGYRKH